ncbi:MAG: hypothetical protein M3Q50_05555, partial [Chloroflexota bacterium]|nr:hypothetical protein [Chloroflexota bacterium]
AGTSLTLAAFITVASPQITAMSKLAGRLSFGETGSIAYAGKVNRYTRWWVGEPEGSGVPSHPVRLIHRSPDAFEFASPERGFSYPFWDEQGYWIDGIRPHFSIGAQSAAIIDVLRLYATFMAPLVLAYGLLLPLSVRAFRFRVPYLVLPAVAVFGLYALVYSEKRYLGAWAPVLFLVAISGFGFTKSRKTIVYSLIGVVAAASMVPVIRDDLSRIRQVVGIFTGYTASHMQWTVATNFRKLDVPPGSQVASIGRAFDGYWARLARVQIAMEINEYDAPLYWAASDSTRRSIHRQFAASGARAVVVNRVPRNNPGPGWMSLGDGYHAMRLDPAGAAQQP